MSGRPAAPSGETSPSSMSSGAKKIVVVTDLDGTLLDAKSYSADVAKPCVARCITSGVPVVACSSKTLSEQLPLHKELGLEGQPFVVENGSAIVAPQGYFTTTHIGQALCMCGFKVQIAKIQRSDLALTYESVVLGTVSAEIGKVLASLKGTIPCLKDLATFDDLSVPELAELTGLSQEAAERAKRRDYSQTICSPLDAAQREALHHELRKHGMTFAVGGRFHTVTAYGIDKGTAVTLLRSLLDVKLEGVVLVGLGEAEHDRSMLQAVDRAFLVRSPDGNHCEAADPFKDCVRVDGVGPRGWVEAVSGVMDSVADKAMLWGNPAALNFPKPTKGKWKSIPECWPCDGGVFDANDFLRDLDQLKQRKREMGVTVSFIFPTLEEEETIGTILQIVNTVREGLLDEVIVIDGDSKDRTREIAEANGAKVILAPEVLPDWKYRGKGIQLWKSLLSTTGDICCWCDSDITNFSEIFVVGLVGPLLVDPDCRYVKAFYNRPLRTGDSQASVGIGGRVTELLARPLINLYYPELRDVIQPLSGEFGGRRKDLERLSFMVQYGVETKLLLEFSRVFGADSIRQVNLHERCHRHQSLPALSKMSFLILQTFLTDMAERFQNPDMQSCMQSTTRIIRVDTARNDNVNKIRSTDRELAGEQHAEGVIAASLQEVTAKEIPLPPIVTQPTYLKSFYPGLSPSVVVLVALHVSEGSAPRAIQEATRSLGASLQRARISFGKVVADVSCPSGLPVRAAADLINLIPDDEVQPQLDVVQLRPFLTEDIGSTRASDIDSEAGSMTSPQSRKAQEAMVELLAGLAYHSCAGDFERGETTSMVIASSEIIKVVYATAYSVDYAKAFEDADKSGQLCTAWRFDYLHAVSSRRDRGGHGSVCGKSSTSFGSGRTPPLTPQRLKSHSSDRAVGVQMRQLPLW